MQKEKEKILKEAEFSEKVKTYWLLTGIIVSVCTVVGIPFLLIWIPLGRYFTGRYLDGMSCVLKSRELIVRKGIFNRVEKTIPLEKITDLGLQQGPIMRWLGLHNLTVETAGQSSGGSLVSLTGIRDVEEFREDVLNQRDKIADGGAAASPAGGPESTEVLLSEIRDILRRIEKQGSAGKGSDQP